MQCIRLKTRNPYFCLAAEEYLLKNFDDDIFLLWQSENTVVVGKHQNALAEINYPYVRKNNIKVARRISGGGTVFHDAGNVNFAFLKSFEKPSEINFRRFLAPIAESLSKLGVETTYSKKDDLLIDGFKVSGNAEHVFKKRVLHHGTLLFKSDLQNLGQAIKTVPGKYESKAVQSNRSKVTNISNYLKEKISIEEFIQFLLDVQLEDASNSIMELSGNDIQNIQKLSEEKFETWEWNFGYSPKYTFKNTFEMDGKYVDIELEVVKGIIESVNLSSNYFPMSKLNQLKKELHGNQHRYVAIKNVLEKTLDNFHSGLTNAFF